ncbi:hypothetical protein [Spongiibacter tropicus]|uniref:hypothetical protein n=1 Tax=Spongiibacter tropicus TaxID=454602 RepID=UPI0004B2C741|nr:hypothetical protein [Spongiibacter tropicus]
MYRLIFFIAFAVASPHIYASDPIVCYRKGNDNWSASFPTYNSADVYLGAPGTMMETPGTCGGGIGTAYQRYHGMPMYSKENDGYLGQIFTFYADPPDCSDLEGHTIEGGHDIVTHSPSAHVDQNNCLATCSLLISSGADGNGTTGNKQICKFTGWPAQFDENDAVTNSPNDPGTPEWCDVKDESGTCRDWDHPDQNNPDGGCPDGSVYGTYEGVGICAPSGSSGDGPTDDPNWSSDPYGHPTGPSDPGDGGGDGGSGDGGDGGGDGGSGDGGTGGGGSGGDGSGDAGCGADTDCDGDVDGSDGSGIGELPGDLYDGSEAEDLTYEGILSDFRDRAMATDLTGALGNYFNLSLGGSCPVYQVSTGPFTVVLDQWCSPDIPWDLVFNCIIFVSLMTAGRIAFG